MHHLIPSAAEIAKGSLWKARPESPPRMLTKIFRQCYWAKHRRSRLGQLLQLSKIPSRRAPITVIQKLNCDGSVNHLLSSCPVVSSQSLIPPVRRLAGLSWVTQRVTGTLGVHISTALKPSYTTTRTKVISTYKLITDLQLMSPSSCCNCIL